jgi:hypothetical protein
MRSKNTPWYLDADNLQILLPLVFLIVVLTGSTIVNVVSWHMESAAFNRITGAHTTWWDAVWVELRVQEAPKVP